MSARDDFPPKVLLSGHATTYERLWDELDQLRAEREGVVVGHSELVERFREALMAEHADDWDMDTVSEAAHVCAAAIGRWSVLRAAM